MRENEINFMCQSHAWLGRYSEEGGGGGWLEGSREYREYCVGIQSAHNVDAVTEAKLNRREACGSKWQFHALNEAKAN